MAFRRAPKRSFRKKRSFKRRTMRRKRSPQNIYHFKRLASLPTQTATTTDLVYTQFFSLAQVPGYTDFTNLYKQYRIKGVKLHVIPSETQAIDATSNAINLRCFSAYSYDEDLNTAGGSTINDVRQLQGCRVRGSLRKFGIYIKNPAYAGIVNASQDAVANLYTRPETGWLDTEYTDIQHLGIVLAWEGSATQAMGVRLEATFYLAFRGTR